MKQPDPFYYKPAWRSLRSFVLRRDGHRCVVCGIDVSAPGAARVDHIKPRRTHPHLELDPTNCRTLCAAHDNQAHREKGGGASRSPSAGGAAPPFLRTERFTARGCDADGWPLPMLPPRPF